MPAYSPDQQYEEIRCATMGVLPPGIIGTMQAAEMLKLMVGTGEVLQPPLQNLIARKIHLLAFQLTGAQIEIYLSTKIAAQLSIFIQSN